MTAAISIRDLTKRYRGFTLDRVGFDIPRGYICGLIGPNGAGKTTIIKLIMQLITDDEGSITIFGEDTKRHGSSLRARIGYVADEPKYYEDVTLTDHARGFSGFYPTWRDDRFLELAEEYELPLKKKWKTLSQGQRTKFALALALAHEPELLVLDEPTSGLDPVFRKKLLDSLSESVRDTGRTVLFSTHVTSDLEQAADFVTFVYEGKIVFSESIESIHGRYSLVKGDRIEAGPDGVLLGTRRGSYGFEALTSNAEDLSASGWEVEPATLEDIMYYTKREAEHAHLDHQA